jgi:hypothetical protein
MFTSGRVKRFKNNRLNSHLPALAQFLDDAITGLDLQGESFFELLE